MGLMLAEPDYHTRCFVEWEPEPRKRIIAAQEAGYFAPAPIWDDVTSFDARPFRGAIDTIIAGYPCQPFSMAGQRKGADDPRHLFPSIERIIDELGPTLRWCFFENVSGHLSLGLDTVLRTLQRLGFRAACGLLSAEEVGAPHERQRIFIVAHREGQPEREQDNPISPVARQNTWESSGGCGRGFYGAELADADGRNARAEWELRCGELGFQPESGGALDDARGERRQQITAGPHGHETAHEGRTQSDSDLATGSIENVDDPTGARCEPTGGGTSAHQRGGECLPGAGCPEMADAGGAEPQGINSGKRDARRRQEPDGHSALCSRTRIFPPGPSDRAAWADVLCAAPSRAPAVTRRDLKAAALRVASLLPTFAQEAHGPGARDMAGDDILRAMGQKTQELVDAAEAIAEFRRMAHGLAQRTPALRIGGNGVVPLVAGYAWRSLSLAHGLGWLDLAGKRDPGGSDGL